MYIVSFINCSVPTLSPLGQDILGPIFTSVFVDALIMSFFESYLGMELLVLQSVLCHHCRDDVPPCNRDLLAI